MTQHAPIEINVREQNGVHIFDVHGRLTIGDSSDQLTAALSSILQNGARKVVIDLNGVPQIDSSGISSLVRMSVSLGREGGSLHLICKPGRVRDALTVTRLVEAIPTFDTLAGSVDPRSVFAGSIIWVFLSTHAKAIEIRDCGHRRLCMSSNQGRCQSLDSILHATDKTNLEILATYTAHKIRHAGRTEKEPRVLVIDFFLGLTAQAIKAVQNWDGTSVSVAIPGRNQLWHVLKMVRN